MRCSPSHQAEGASVTDLTSLDAFQLAAAYRDGAASPVEVARAVLARIDAVEPKINATCWRDDAHALAQAKASEARWRAGAPLGGLDGMPVTIKDNVNVAGWPCRKGSAQTPEAPVEEDAPAAARLREAGAVILCKTTMPEFGWKGTSDSPRTGITRNPWDLSTTTGGSSAGAAALAALGLGRIHVGTDGAGSVRIPAAFCGVVALKPSYGRVPAYPVSTMGPLAHLGPIAPSVAEIALAMNALARPDARDMSAVLAETATDWTRGLDGGVKGLRVAFSPKLGFDVDVDPCVAVRTREAAAILAALGAQVEEVDPGFEDPIEPLMTLWRSGAALALRDIPPARWGEMDPGFVEVAQAGASIPASAFVEALLYQRNALAATMARFHARFDLLLTPTMPLPAFEAGRLTPAHGRYGDVWTRWSPFTYPFNLTQQPAISVPSGLTRQGLPTGLQIVGAFGADALVLRVAAAFERARGPLGSPRGL
jgi:aspartyl-tRNA(Asn)/glutamyl-tRNA(Gln) amidotransferase subunit A